MNNEQNNEIFSRVDTQNLNKIAGKLCLRLVFNIFSFPQVHNPTKRVSVKNNLKRGEQNSGGG